jgi:hypothetical protein
MAEQGTHKPRVGSSSLPVATYPVMPLCCWSGICHQGHIDLDKPLFFPRGFYALLRLTVGLIQRIFTIEIHSETVLRRDQILMYRSYESFR